MENQIETTQQELSEDELYAKIQTEKLLKKKKTKKISTLVGVCFAFVLAVILIVLGAVPVSLMPRCVSDDFYQVNMFAGSSTSDSTAFEKGEKGYKEFRKVFKKAFSQTYLSALFSGTLFQYDDIEETLIDEKEAIGASGSLISNDSYYIYLQYTTPQVLTKQNGSVYESRYSNSNWDGKLTFSKVYITVSEEAGLKETKIYLPVKYPEYNDKNEYVGESKEKIVSITIKANTNYIYKAWEDLIKL